MCSNLARSARTILGGVEGGMEAVSFAHLQRMRSSILLLHRRKAEF